VLLTIGAALAAWMMLSLLSGERQRKLERAQSERAERLAAAATDAPPPPPAKSKKPPSQLPR